MLPHMVTIVFFDNWKLCINQISVPVGVFIKINAHVSAISAFNNFHAQWDWTMSKKRGRAPNLFFCYLIAYRKPTGLISVHLWIHYFLHNLIHSHAIFTSMSISDCGINISNVLEFSWLFNNWRVFHKSRLSRYLLFYDISGLLFQ